MASYLYFKENTGTLSPKEKNSYIAKIGIAHIEDRCLAEPFVEMGLHIITREQEITIIRYIMNTENDRNDSYSVSEVLAVDPELNVDGLRNCQMVQELGQVRGLVHIDGILTKVIVQPYQFFIENRPLTDTEKLVYIMGEDERRIIIELIPDILKEKAGIKTDAGSIADPNKSLIAGKTRQEIITELVNGSYFTGINSTNHVIERKRFVLDEILKFNTEGPRKPGTASREERLFEIAIALSGISNLDVAFMKKDLASEEVIQNEDVWNFVLEVKGKAFNLVQGPTPGNTMQGRKAGSSYMQYTYDQNEGQRVDIGVKSKTGAFDANTQKEFKFGVVTVGLDDNFKPNMLIVERGLGKKGIFTISAEGRVKLEESDFAMGVGGNIEVGEYADVHARVEAKVLAAVKNTTIAKDMRKTGRQTKAKAQILDSLWSDTDDIQKRNEHIQKLTKIINEEL